MLQLLHDGHRFFRGVYFGHTWLLILLGAGSVDADSPARVTIGLILIGLNYHCFGYVHNDLIDLPVDRRQPLRSLDPLVTGKISVRSAWMFALVQIPVSYVAAWWIDASTAAVTVLTLGYATTLLYNLYGKKCPIPIVTDAVQGIAWGSLAMFGAFAVGEPTMLTWLPVGFGFGFIFLINGVHGGLRDLRNDTSNGCVTTAIYLGATPSHDDQVRSSYRLQVFAAAAFTILVAPGAAMFSLQRLPYEGNVLQLTLGAWLLLQARSGWLLGQVVKIENPQRNLVISQNQLPLLVPPILIMFPALAFPLQMTVGACFFLPFLLFDRRIHFEAIDVFSNWRTAVGLGKDEARAHD